MKESRDASDDRCDSLATALANYARAKVASEERRGGIPTSWAVDVSDNPDSARTLACALIGNSLSDTLCILHVFFYGIIHNKKTYKF